MDGKFDDPVLELARRIGDGPGDVFELASEVSDADARTVLEVLDEVEAEAKASDLASRLRQQGHTL